MGLDDLESLDIEANSFEELFEKCGVSGEFWK